MSTPLQAVYVMTCTGRNRFSAMAYLAVKGLKRVHPDARAVLVCDPETRDRLAADFPELLDQYDRVIPTPSDVPDVLIRSRYLKTTIRDAVDGDLVYLDIDTLPVSPFADIAAGSWDVAAVQDRNHHCPVEPVFPYWREDDYRKLGWPSPLPKFFNSGVVFLRDNAKTRDLGRRWTARWRELAAIGRSDDDQFALTTAIFDTPGLVVNELDIRFNAMVAAHPCHARGAKVYHFFAGGTKPGTNTLADHLITRYLATGEIDWPTVDRCVAMGHPWVPPYWPRRLWQTGHRGLAVRLALGGLPRRLLRTLRGNRGGVA
jgi:hypothetical protein